MSTPKEISEVLSKFATQYANIVVYAPSNALIITETGRNLKKLRQLIRRFDTPGGQDQLWTYQVVHAEAADIAAKIQEVYEKDGKSTAKSPSAPAPRARRARPRPRPRAARSASRSWTST